MPIHNLDRLIKSIIEGDENAFKSLFDHFYPELLNYAWYISGSKFAAEEIVSAVFINFWQTRKKLPDVKNLNSYLFISVKNRSYNYLRDNGLRIIREDEKERFQPIITFENPESQYLSNELRTIILNAIEELPDRCRMVFRLVREDGLKYQEAADLLDISVKTVEVQMGRATAKLKSALEPYLKDLPLSSRSTKTA
jgi:RNA polymerase sigma-70 factor (family 1)